MKKRFLAIILTVTLALVSVIVCSASVEEAAAGTEEAAEDNAIDISVFFDVSDVFSDKILETVFDAAGVTKEDMDSLYEFISASITENYLEVHNISASDFVIPEDIDWSYLLTLAQEYSTFDSDIDEVLDTVQRDYSGYHEATDEHEPDSEGYEMSSDTYEILNAFFIGAVNWYNENPSAVRAEFYEDIAGIPFLFSVFRDPSILMDPEKMVSTTE